MPESGLIRALLAAVNAGLVQLDRDGTILEINESNAGDFNLTRAQARGRCVWDFFTPEVAERRRRIIDGVFVGGRPARVRDERDGLKFDYCIQPVIGADGAVDSVVVYSQEITERVRTEDALRQREARLRSIFRAAPAGIGLVVNRVIEDVNEKICEMTGFSREELVDKSARVLYPDDAEFEMVGRVKYEQIAEHGTGSVETHWLRKDGRFIDVLLSSTPLDADDLSAGVTFTALDITDRKSAARELAESLAEKEALLRELYHRTKNNMQVICSLLNLRGAQASDERVKRIFDEMKNRILSMSLVHQKLYRSHSLTSLDLGGYIDELATLFLESHDTLRGRVRIDRRLAELPVSIETAIPCGLILSELFSNSFKHAFPDGRPGVITIGLSRRADGEIELGFADDGVGVPAGFDWRGAETFGLMTLTTLVEHQLGGRIEVEGAGGFSVRIIFGVAGRD